MLQICGKLTQHVFAFSAMTSGRTSGQ